MLGCLLKFLPSMRCGGGGGVSNRLERLQITQKGSPLEGVILEKIYENV